MKEEKIAEPGTLLHCDEAARFIEQTRKARYPVGACFEGGT